MPLISSENEDIEDRGIQLVTRLEDWILTHPDDHDGAWHSPPTLEPIDIVGDWHRPLYGAVEAPRHQSLAPMPPSRIGRRDYGMNNPYAAIASSDDQDDTEDEAGDEVLLEPTTTTYIHGMTLLRSVVPSEQGIGRRARVEPRLHVSSPCVLADSRGNESRGRSDFALLLIRAREFGRRQCH